MSTASTKKIAPANMVNQLLDTVGDGTGTTDMTRSTSTIYKCVPPSGTRYVLARINVYVEDGTNEKFSAAKYGATQAIDSTGIVMTVEDASGVIHTVNPKPITKIGHWDLNAGIDMLFTSFPAGSSDMCAIRYTFAKSVPGGLLIDGTLGEFFKFHVQGDLSDLVEHFAQLQGYKEDS